MLNTPTVYVLLGGYVHQEPKLYGIYDNLDSLREAVVEIATPIREEMQRVLPYRECLLKANRDWGVTGVELERMATYPECLSEKENLCGCHLNAEKRGKCHHYKSRSQYEEELEEALEKLQYPAQNVYVVETSLNNLPERGAFFDTFKNHHINGRWYQLFSPYTYPSVSELYNGEEIFNLYEGPLSDMEPEIRKRMEEEKRFIRKWLKMPYSMQISNIGSEVHRAIRWKNKGMIDRSVNFYERADEFLAYTLDDPKNAAMKEELEYCMDELWEYFIGDNKYHATEESLVAFYDQFLIKQDTGGDNGGK